ncbi:MAG TPA: hypothetical protein VEL74_12620 [Thermoanaerobaculia bacterium]|nr:hypothetical protein [Thermoanaerobaculia bacterium]
MRRAVLRTALAVLLIAPAAHALTLDQTIGGCGGLAPTRTIQANPSTYKSLIAGLLPGDRMLLAPGTYTQGLRLHGKNGQPNKCIVIEGPATGTPALFVGSGLWNTVSLRDNSYLVIRNLQLDGKGLAGDGVKAEVESTYTHHITLENLKLVGYGQSDQRVGINTKSRAWNWVIRYVTIERAGTGMYLGKSDGTGEFVNGLIEHNLVSGTLGYNVQIKHQKSRATGIGIPAAGTTVIRHNVFSKANNSLTGTAARPNLLVGHWPLSGAGSTDTYQIYGNLFYQNPGEALFQGEGNIALHDNLFVNHLNRAVRIQRHNNLPRKVDVYRNTIVAKTEGIHLYNGDPAYPQRLTGNVVFAASPLSGGVQSANVIGAYASAVNYLVNPMGTLGTLDLYPKSGQLQSLSFITSFLTGYLDWDKDFNGQVHLPTFRGAYSGDGVNPGWKPALAIKP